MLQLCKPLLMVQGCMSIGLELIRILTQGSFLCYTALLCLIYVLGECKRKITTSCYHRELTAFVDVLACRVAAIWGRKPMVKLVVMSLLMVRMYISKREEDLYL